MYYLKWHNASAGRYYCLHVQRDLFQHWSVVCIWGGIGSKLGGMRNYSFQSQADALEFIEIVKQKRHNRGYAVMVDNHAHGSILASITTSRSSAQIRQE